MNSIKNISSLKGAFAAILFPVLLISSLPTLARFLTIPLPGKSKIAVAILADSTKCLLLKQLNGRQDDSLRKKWTARTLIKLLCVCLFFSSAYSQNLKKAAVSDKEKSAGVVKIYLYAGKYDGSISLILYRNKSFYYTLESTNYNAFTKGRWSTRNNDIYLSSEIADTAVPVAIKYFPGVDSISMKSPFLMPVNLKGDKFPDARIYINNDTTYCFPFFDTCVGHYTMVNKIKIDFGDGFKSKWIKVSLKENAKLLFVAQTEFVFSSYLSFKRKRFKVVGDELEPFKADK